MYNVCTSIVAVHDHSPSQNGYRGLLAVAKMGSKYAEVVQAFLDAGWSPGFSLEVSCALCVFSITCVMESWMGWLCVESCVVCTCDYNVLLAMYISGSGNSNDVCAQ